MPSKTLQMDLELPLKEHLISQQAFVLNNLEFFFDLYNSIQTSTAAITLTAVTSNLKPSS